jgi:RNA polymerase sigma factor (TIGR02999 family)
MKLMLPADEDSRLVELARIAGSESPEDADAFFVALYQELHRKAQQQMAGQPADHTLQPTALVNEVYLRISEYKYSDRDHFLAVAAKAMRRVLVDHARRLRTDKREVPATRLALDHWLDRLEARPGRTIDLLIFEELLEELHSRSPESARLVELRFYGGLTNQDCARILEMPLRTLESRWHATRAWLAAQLRPDS